MTRATPTANRQATQARWHRLSEDLDRLATEADFDAALHRVGELMAREAMALGASSAWPQRKDKHNDA